MKPTAPIFKTFRQMLQAKAIDNPTGIAFQYLDDKGISSITYHNFQKAVLEKVDEYKLAKCSSIAVIGPLSVQFLVSFFASVMSGKTTMLIDAMLPIDAILGMIRMSNVEVIELTDDDYFDQDEIAKMSQSLSKPTNKASDIEGDILFFTSGTSSLSKAVVLDSRSLLRSVYNGQSRLQCGPGDVILASLPMSHVFGFVCSMLWPFVNGAITAISRGMRNIPQDLSAFKVTILPQVPTAVNMLLKFNAFNPELRVILIGAGPISYGSIKAIRQKGIGVSFGYGLTETSSGVAISVLKDDPYAMDLCPDTVVKIDEDGEILLRTPCLMKCYYHDPKSTNEVIDGEGYLKTNDIGYLDDNGCLHVTGRKNDVIVLGNGTKVNMEVWEQELASFLPGVDYAISYQDGKFVLHYHSKDGSTSVNDVIEAVNAFNATRPMGQSIGGYRESMVPIPRTLTGKIKRYALAK